MLRSAFRATSRSTFRHHGLSSSPPRSGVVSRGVASVHPSPGPGRLQRLAYGTVKYCGITTIGFAVIVAGFFAYDSMTYVEHARNAVAVPSLALTPNRGGPKNLPIAEEMIDEYEDGDAKPHGREKLVILGSGWGAVSVISRLNPDAYDVTVISPSNYFLFTPLLPSACVGTVEIRSIVEPIRKIIRRIRGHYLEASAETVDFANKLIEVVESPQCSNGKEPRRFYVPYDKLILSVGAAQNTHGVDGIEHCRFLKTTNDCIKIRAQVMDNFEKACMPTTTDEERKRLLSFVVCGGGPTGVEFAAELYDMVNEDMCEYFPKILRNEVSVHVIQSRDHILNTYDKTISQYAESRFAKNYVNVEVNARVQKVEKDKVVFSQKMSDGKTVTKELPYGLCLWSTGVSLAPITEHIRSQIPVQTNRHALETDPHLRVVGTPLGDVYAIGDCSTVQNNVTEHVLDFVEDEQRHQVDRGEELTVTREELDKMAVRIKKAFPQASDHLTALDRLFDKHDLDHNGVLSLSELKSLLEGIDKKLTSLPATAQRAHQQGNYLANKLNALHRAKDSFALNEIVDGDVDSAVYKRFRYNHLGSLAYLGNAAVGDLPGGYTLTGGLIAMYAWRSVYWSETVSLRSRLLIAIDWAKRAIWGRDLSRF
ncbi:hypothetical protein PYCC9005_003609 [Savitreella phatthalungensis]